MGRKIKINRDVIYLNKRLLNKLIDISNYPITILYAPMGYGKTTAIKEALKNIKGKVIWQNIYSDNFNEFSNEFFYKFFDSNNIEYISNRELIHRIENKIKSIGEPIFFVIDNLEVAENKEIYDYILFLISNIPKELHIIMATRNKFPREDSSLILGNRINFINYEDLSLKPEEIKAYFNLAGIKITMQEAEILYKKGDGWISLLNMYVQDYTTDAIAAAEYRTRCLIEKKIFNKFTKEERNLLIYISIYSEITEELIRYIFNEEEKVTILKALSKKNTFVLFNPSTNTYKIHPILKEILYNEFLKLDKKEKNRLIDKAGDWYKTNKKVIVATECYYASNNLEKLLDTIVEDKLTSFTGEYRNLLEKYYESFPREIKEKNPLGMLMYAMFYMVINNIERFKEILKFTKESILKNESLSLKERNQLLGEYELILSFSKYNDIKEMTKHHIKAGELMSENSEFLKDYGPWTFGCPSILQLYHRKAGALDLEVAESKKSMPYYLKVTNNNGIGATEVMEGELYYNKGNMLKAAILSEKAMRRSEEEFKSGVFISATFLQIRVLLFNGSYNELRKVYKELEEKTRSSNSIILLYSLYVCKLWINVALRREKEVTKWLKENELKRIRMLHPMVPFVNIVYGQVLILQKEYIKLLSLREEYIKAARIYPNITSEIYIYIQCCAAYANLGKYEEAREELKRALELSMEDKFYMPFVENGFYIKDVLKSIVQKEWKGDIEVILKLIEQCEESRNKIIKAYFPSKEINSLTPREKEISKLVSEGLSNKEIAKELFITESTVKQALWIVFQKLGIKSRIELMKIYNNL